jgi:tetratricopeptide (TPR) repeat protein
MQQPHELKEVDPEALQQLSLSYPYFTLAHLMQMIKLDEWPSDDYPRHFHGINPVMLHELRAQSEFLAIDEDLILADELIAAEAAAYTVADTVGNVSAPTEAATTEEELLETPPSKEDLMDALNIASGTPTDYFSQQGIKVSDEMPTAEDLLPSEQTNEDEESMKEREQSLLVMMSFSEWLNYINAKNKKAKEEEAEQKALKTQWQKQKLAAAIEEELEEIPEMVFEMAVNSIAAEDGLVSESLAEVYGKQGKKEKAIDMYRKLILQNPEKKAYFANKIDLLLKEN